MGVCIVNGCTSTFRVVKNLCSRHYQQFLKGLTVEQMEVALTAALPAPKIVPVKRRCPIRMNGIQCVRERDGAKRLCFAHAGEAEDRAHFQLREQPIESSRFEYEGNEAALAEKYGSNSNV